MKKRLKIINFWIIIGILINLIPIGAAEVEPNWPAGKPNVRQNPWDGFIDFEDGTDREVIRSTIPGMEFTTTRGLDWIYGDKSTGNYNIYPYWGGSYEINGNVGAWLGASGDQGRIDFPEGTATYFSCLVSTGSGVIIDAYDSNDNFLATSGWAGSNINTRTLTRLTVSAPGIAYVIIHDSGNYWIIDDITTDANGVPSAHYEAAELAKQVIGVPYLWGGKGWDYGAKPASFADPEDIINGYKYYNPKKEGKDKLDTGSGLDCSGLILWAYNKAYGSEKYISDGNPVRFEGAHGQYINNFKIDITEGELKPGDLLFFDAYKDKGYSQPGQDNYIDHVAMYVGPFSYNGVEYNVVESRGGAGVRPTTVKDIIKRIETLAGEKSFVGFRRLVEPEVKMEIKVRCPVDLIVTDPDGVKISKEIYEVPGVFYYSVWDIDGDGDLDDIIFLPIKKNGDYIIEVIPEPDADPTETYTLEVRAGDSNLVLAKDVPIGEIPALPYIITSTEDGVSFNPPSIPPIIVKAGPDQTVEEGTTVNFEGSFEASELRTYSYQWDFGDGSVEEGSLTTSHTYADDGVYTVSLTVTDEDGNFGNDTLLITVNNAVPVVDSGADIEVTAGDPVYFRGTFSDPGWLDTHTAEWNFGEGTIEAGSVSEENEFPYSTGTVSGSFSYFNPGEYTVTLIVTDDDGGIGQDEIIVTVHPIVATINFDPDTLNLGSNGQWVTVYIELPEKYNPAEIDASSVLLNGAVSAVTDPKYNFVTDESEYLTDLDLDGISERMLKFSYPEVSKILKAGNQVKVTFKGKVEYNNGISSGMASFEGNDVIRVIESSSKKDEKE